MIGAAAHDSTLIVVAVITVFGAIVGATITGYFAYKANKQSKVNHDAVQTVIAEVTPNHGSSMKDKLDEVATMVRSQGAQFISFQVKDAEWKGHQDERWTQHERRHDAESN